MRETINQVQVLKDAIEKYGKQAQVIKAIEELSELQQALAKSLNGYTDISNIAEEIGDCRIMLDQLDYIFDVENESWKAYDEKLYRLKKRMENDKTKEEKEKVDDVIKAKELNDLVKMCFGIDLLADLEKADDKHSLTKLLELYFGK